jgi:UDP-glucose 4-epimerase
MVVLVTGGAGFIGTNLIKRLNESGEHIVYSLDNYSTGLEENHQDGASYMFGDLRIITDFDIYGQPDVVFHMAATARIQPSFESPVDYFTCNVNSTLNLVDWCAKAEVPIIYAGSSSKHSGRFKNPYTFSKDVGEDIIKLYQKHFKLKASVARFYNVYGPHQLKEGPYTTLIGKWMNDIEEGKDCFIYGDGEKRRDFTHVDDVVRALNLISSRSAYGYNFELGRGKNYSVNEVAKMFEIGPAHKEDKPGEALETLNTDKTAEEILKWKPELNLEDYINSWKSRDR